MEMNTMEVQSNINYTTDEIINNEVFENNAQSDMQEMYTMDYSEYDNSFVEESTNGNSVAFFITIGICITLGIVLGIIFGRKSALK